MFSEYKTLVINSYKRKREAGTLSFNLQHLTPARVKKECLAIISERHQATDGRILKNFFGNSDGVEQCALHIKKTHPDKFRPLINYLKEKTKHPDDKNIELLAWLIDFSPRPYLFGQDYQNITNDLLNTNRENQNEINESLIKEALVEMLDRLKTKNNNSEESDQSKWFAIEKKKRKNQKFKPTSRLNNTTKGIVALGVVGIISMILLLSSGKSYFKKNSM